MQLRSLALQLLFFFLPFVSPLVDFELANVQLLGKRFLLIIRPGRVLLELGLKDAGFYFPEAISISNDALLASEVNNNPAFCLRIFGTYLQLLYLFKRA